MLGQNLFVLAALTATAAPLPKDDDTGLRTKFEKGRTFYQEVTTHTSQIMTVMGTEVKQTQVQTFVMSWTPEKQDGDRWVLRHKIEAIKMEISFGGDPITYDSTKPKAAKGGLDDLFGALIGNELRITLDKGFQVVRVEGREELIKKLSSDKPERQALIRDLLSEEAVKEMANPMVIAAPRRKVEKGDYWVREKTTDLGAVGRWVGNWQYVHAGKENKLIKLKLEAIKFEYQPPKEGAGGAIPFRVTSSNVKVKNTAGMILFDPEKGCLHSAEMKMDMEGDMTIDISGQETKLHLVQTQKTTYKVSDTNPVTKK
jgi:hypothetical protein